MKKNSKLSVIFGKLGIGLISIVISTVSCRLESVRLYESEISRQADTRHRGVMDCTGYKRGKKCGCAAGLTATGASWRPGRSG